MAKTFSLETQTTQHQNNEQKQADRSAQTTKKTTRSKATRSVKWEAVPSDAQRARQTKLF
jgi:hypothetical protein